MSDRAQQQRNAADWFVAVHSAEDPAPELVEEWLQWLEASEEHKSAFEDVARIWRSTTPPLIRRTKAVLNEPDYDGSMPIAEWRAHLASRPAPHIPRVRRPWGRRRARTLIAASAAALVVAVVLFSFHVLEGSSKQPLISQGEFTTRTGEQMDLMLADGSRMALGPRSRLTIAFSRTGRQVQLDAGEAFFSVYKDAHRPFSVLALDGSITALGTAFDVRALGNHVTVTVKEGAVRVLDLDSTLVQVSSGEQATYGLVGNNHSRHRDQPVVTRVDSNESGRWRDGWLIYRNESLKDVIADLSRYTNLKVDVEESAGDLRFSGAVSTDRISEWVVALPEVSPVAVEQDHDHVAIKLRSGAILINQ